MSEQSKTRRDLEASARRLVGDTSRLSESAASTMKTAGPAAAVLAALVAFAYGRRRGRRRATYGKIKRPK